jgi:hypothetical protein
VAKDVFVQHVSGAYSSGSVQDLHLIPFSFQSEKSLRNTMITVGKDRDYFGNLRK